MVASFSARIVEGNFKPAPAVRKNDVRADARGMTGDRNNQQIGVVKIRHREHGPTFATLPVREHQETRHLARLVNRCSYQSWS
jgi:hypothetical protein